MILDTVIGIVAATLTTSSFIPQLIRAYRSKRIEDVSPYLFSSGALLWLLYGMYRNDAIIITANIFALAFNIILLYMRVRYVEKGNS